MDHGSGGPPGTPSGASRGRPLGLLAWLAFVVAWLVWTPWGPFGEPSRLVLAPPTGALEIVLNLLLMAPLGVVVALTGPRGGKRGGALEAAGTAFAFSVVVELVQGLAPGLGRVASPYDVLFNTTGAAAAGGLAVAAVRWLGVRRRWLVAVAAVAVFAGAGTYMLGSAVRSARGLAIERWNPSYPVLAGDEAGGGRRYVGTVTGARICAGPPDREVCAGPGAGPARRAALATAAELTDRVRIQARVLSRSNDQRGPARIVTFSNGVLDRNVTLGQEGQALVLRVRTPRLGMNGASVAFVMGRAVRAGRPARVEASFVRGRVEMRATDASGSRVGSFPTGLLPSWWYVRPGLREHGSVTPRYLVVASALGAAVLLTPVAYAMAGIGAALLPALGLASVASVAALVLVNAFLGSATSAFGVLFVLTASVAGVLLRMADRRARSVASSGPGGDQAAADAPEDGRRLAVPKPGRTMSVPATRQPRRGSGSR